MVVRREHDNGGYFDSIVPVLPHFLFTRIDGPPGSVQLDPSDLGLGPLPLQAFDVPWSQDDAGLTTQAVPCGSGGFFPGVLNDGLHNLPCCEEASHSAGSSYPDGHLHVVKPQGCLVECVVVPPGEDCWSTSCGSDTRFNFCDTPIPADFFDPGSEPFAGEVELGGAGTGIDTRVERLDEMDLSGPDGVPVQDTVDIQLVELSLTSCSPITVIVNSTPELWDVAVDLSSAPAPTGNMVVTKDHPNGGLFSSDFFVQPVFTFTRQGDAAVRVLDIATDEVILPPIQFGTVGQAPWVHRPSNEVSNCGEGFVPGVEENLGDGSQCCKPVGHSSEQPGHIHETAPPDCSLCVEGACCEAVGLGAGTCSEATAGTCAGEFLGEGTGCADSDLDGIPDVQELNNCTQCSLPPYDQCRLPTAAFLSDTDGDGVDDNDELLAGTDPCDVLSF